MLGLSGDNTNIIWWYDSELNNGRIVYNGHIDKTFPFGSWGFNACITMDDTGINFLSHDNFKGKPGFVLAFKFK